MAEVVLRADPARVTALFSQLESVRQLIQAATPKALSSPPASKVRLVAVSKLKPASDILALAEPSSAAASPQLHFGENYAQELSQKAKLLPQHIQWHFIGGLQSSHCKSLAKIPNLWCVSSIDSVKKARLLNKARGDIIAQANQAAQDVKETPKKEEEIPEMPKSDAQNIPPINVHVQVNTSGEESKSGCDPGADTVTLCRLIVEECPHLRLLGLMTIGSIARSQATTSDGSQENEDFRVLREQRRLVAEELGLTGPEALELSMGMSEDFEGAIAMGSSEVRVGSLIFGTRPPKSEAVI